MSPTTRSGVTSSPISRVSGRGSGISGELLHGLVEGGLGGVAIGHGLRGGALLVQVLGLLRHLVVGDVA